MSLMDDFGNNFDDSLFESEKPAKKNAPISYNAKKCEPEWFLNEESAIRVSNDEHVDILKFRGDYFLHKKEFKKALAAYEELLDGILPKNNVVVRRDVLTSMITCRINENMELDEALTSCIELVQTAPCEEQEFNSLMTLNQVHLTRCDYEEVVLVLRKLLALQPSLPELWEKLGHAYLNLCTRVKILLPLESGETNGLIKEFSKWTLESEEIWRRKALMCYLRSKHLLNWLSKTATSFVRDRLLLRIEFISNEIEKLKFSENEVKNVVKYLYRDKCDGDEEIRSGSRLDIHKEHFQLEFENTWFSWVRNSIE